MNKDNIFTMASVKGAPASAEDIATAEEELGVAGVSESRRRRLREFAGGFTPAKVRAMPEYKRLLSFVMNRDLPGIHPDDVKTRWESMFGPLVPGQLSAIIDALEIDGALDKMPTYESRLRKIKGENGKGVMTMKITEAKLRQIIREEKARMLKEGRGRVQLEDVEPGVVYELSSKGAYGPANSWTAEFVRWDVDSQGPRMVWRDTDDGTEWEAYLFESVFSVGSSATPLQVIRVVPMGAGDVV